MKVDDIPGFEFNAATNTVKLPMGKLFTGWYYHETDVLGFNDAGVFEWYGFPNEYSLFEGCNWGFAENRMNVNMHAAMTAAQKQFAALSFDQTQTQYVLEN